MRDTVKTFIICLTAAILFSFTLFHPLIEHHHDCADTHCPVCLCIRHFARVLDQSSTFTTAAVMAEALICLVFINTLLRVCVNREAETPVRCQIRLNN